MNSESLYTPKRQVADLVNFGNNVRLGAQSTGYRPKSPPPVKFRSASKQDSSKDYFTLQFYSDEAAPLGTEKVPVRKGKSLKESIEIVLLNHGLNFATHSVFLEASNTPLPLMFDTFPLAGNTLHVKANQAMQIDERIITLMKEEDRKPQNQRQKKNLMTMFIDDNDGSSKSSSLSRDNSNQNLKSRSSSSKDLTKSNLTDILACYETNGFTLEFEEEDSIGDTDFVLEESWTEVIEENENMLVFEKIQQEAIWELLTTERNYLRILKLVTQVFQHCLRNLQYDNFLTEVDSHKLFSNIGDIYHTNLVFWKEILNIITMARHDKKPIKPSQLCSAFSNFEAQFEPYIIYCLEESLCVKYLKQLKTTNEYFEEYLTWCENRPQCNRLKLQDLLVKPMQRITKYGLLLKAVARKTKLDREIKALDLMTSQVENFVMKINTTMRTKHERHKLNQVLKRIEMYYPVDPVNEDVEKIMVDFCSLNLHGNIPGLPDGEQRCLLLEAPMKMTEKQGKSEVHVFLFTDVLILAKLKKGGDKLRIIRQPYRLNKVVIQPVKEPNSFLLIYLNEYGVLVSAFILQVTTSDYHKWIQAIDKAKTRYIKARGKNGSTLDFYDDDIFASSTQFTNECSPAPDRHLLKLSDDSPSTVVTETMALRSKSSIQISGSQPANHPELAVKRSSSDPKSSWNRDKRKARPISLISSTDRDTASWVLTNEKRNRSGSIPSDASEDSRRSSGIGDSFRSINSDGAIPASTVSTLSKVYSSLPEVSNVMKLKAKFEHDSQSSSTDGSNNSITTKTVNPDFFENHSTIHEEEELSNYSYDKKSEPCDQNPYENIDLIRATMFKTPTANTKTETSASTDLGIQCTLLPVSDLDQQLEHRMLRLDPCTVDDMDEFVTIDDIVLPHILTKDTSTQSTPCFDFLTSVGTQSATSCITCDASTQCGDFIHLTGLCESDTEDGEADKLETLCTHVPMQRPSSAPPCSSEVTPRHHDTPMMALLDPTLAYTKPPKGILKHSFSEAIIPLNKHVVRDFEVVHSRSQSDEPKQSSLHSPPQQKHRNSTSTYDFPGMRALKTLSESLEFSVHNRKNVSEDTRAPTPLNERKDTGQAKAENNKIDVLAEAKSSHSQNHSPANLNKSTKEPVNHKKAAEKQLNNREQSHIELCDKRPISTFVPLREHTDETLSKVNNSKRNTWHDFDSLVALKEIERTKYGSQGGLDRVTDNLKTESLNRNQSQSTELLDTRKRRSVKKSFFKKYSSPSLPISVHSSTDAEHLDQKSLKKLQKKEEERIKKEKKLKEKEDKKRNKKERNLTLGKSGSFTSTSSLKSKVSNGE